MVGEGKRRPRVSGCGEARTEEGAAGCGRGGGGEGSSEGEENEKRRTGLSISALDFFMSVSCPQRSPSLAGRHGKDLIQ